MTKRLSAMIAVLAVCFIPALSGEEAASPRPESRPYKETGPAVPAVRRITSNSPSSRDASPAPRNQVVRLTLPSAGNKPGEPRYRMVEAKDDSESGTLRFDFENSVPIAELPEFPLPEPEKKAAAETPAPRPPGKIRPPAAPAKAARPASKTGAGVFPAAPPTKKGPPIPETMAAPRAALREILDAEPLARPEVARIPGLDPPLAANTDQYNRMVLAPRPELDMLDLIVFQNDPAAARELALQPLEPMSPESFERQPRPALLQVPPPIMRDAGEEAREEVVYAMGAPTPDPHHAPEPARMPPPRSMVDLSNAAAPPAAPAPLAAEPAPTPSAPAARTASLRPPSSFGAGGGGRDLVPSPGDLMLTATAAHAPIPAMGRAGAGEAPGPLMPPPGFLLATPSDLDRRGPAPVIQDYGLLSVNNPPPKPQGPPPTLKQYAEIAELEEIDGFTPMREVKFF